MCYNVNKLKRGDFMKFFKPADYDYIMNKYHSQAVPFDPETRFSRYDAVFEGKPGVDGDEIHENIVKRDEEIKDLPHPVRKASAFKYIMENTKISCDSRDIFPAINMIDRPLNKTLLNKWNSEIFIDKMPDIKERRWFLINTGICQIFPDYDHSVPNWDFILELGFKGLLEKSEKARRDRENMTEEEDAFFEGIKITYEGILALLDRLEKQAKVEGNTRLEKALANIKENPPKTFHEAMLVDYIYFILCEHIEGLQVRSISNFDRLFYKYYKSDLENGMTEEQLRCDLAYFLLQFPAIGNYWSEPVFLGGCKEDESTEINELSYVFLDVYDQMNIFNPKIQIKVAPSTPKDFLLKALDMIRRGHSSIVFLSDSAIRKVLESEGLTSDQARLCNIKGCYEYACQEDMTVGMNYISLLKPLELAFHKGYDFTSGKFIGLESPDVSVHKTFDEFLAEYKRQLGFLLEEIMDVVNAFEGYLSYINPQGMISATYETSLKTAKDPLCGGSAANGSLLLCGFLADIADSLAVIKKYVFDEKRLTLQEFVDILDKDYVGHEKFRMEILADRDKFGNNKELPDAMANEVVDFLIEKVAGKPNAVERGGTWAIGFHVARATYENAPIEASAPNGRVRGEELAKNLSASQGMNREGATAAILTAVKNSASKHTWVAPLDLGLLPSAVKGDDGLEAMYDLLMSFVNLGGQTVQFNVFDAETLRAAQREPEKYQDLQIRVAGWNVLFNNIDKVEQDGFIRQAEELI